jgi:methylthioribose-1-phosphate isomerase
MHVNGILYQTIWMENGTVHMINQPRLPHVFEIITCNTCADTAEAIRSMTVRGAGAIGAAAGFALAQAVREAAMQKKFRETLQTLRTLIVETRPTAQNLFYAVNRVYEAAISQATIAEAVQKAELEATAIAEEDVRDGEGIGRVGSILIHDGMRILTHCNAGWLAFVDWGSALAPIYYSARQKKNLWVWVDETRPRMQGANLTSWELKNEGIPHAIIADNAAGYFMQRGEVDLVIVGADRVARNGDAANKIGTFEKAVLAKRFGIPFYVAIPPSTVDLQCTDGDHIPIEERSMDEVLYTSGLDDGGLIRRVRTTPEGVAARNPAFDITPAELISGFITPIGIFTAEQIKEIY